MKQKKASTPPSSSVRIDKGGSRKKWTVVLSDDKDNEEDMEMLDQRVRRQAAPKGGASGGRPAPVLERMPTAGPAPEVSERPLGASAEQPGQGSSGRPRRFRVRRRQSDLSVNKCSSRIFYVPGDVQV